MKTFYFSFGHTHTHLVNGITFDKSCLVEIEAENSEEAREVMFDFFGKDWSSEYEEKPDMEFYPRGIKKLNYEEAIK